MEPMQTSEENITDETLGQDVEEMPTPDQRQPLPPWPRIAMAVVVLIVLVVLVGPRLLEQFGRGEEPPSPTFAQMEQAVQADPTNDGLRYDLAGAYYRAGRFEEAWSQLHSIEAYAATLNTSEAIASAEKAVQADPSSKEAHFKLGTAWAHAQLFAPAEVAFQQAIALDNEYVDARVNLGVVYYQLNRLSDALAQYDAALAVQPNDADVHHNRGTVYVQVALQSSPPNEEVLDQGVEDLQRALELNPDLFQAHFSLGVVHDLRGEKEAAIAAFERFVELDDGSDPQATTAAQSHLERLRQ